MIDTELQAIARAAREFGRIQVHQHFRALAKELGLPEECTAPPAPEPPRFQRRWLTEVTGSEITDREWRFLEMSPAQRYVALAIKHPSEFARGGLLAGSVA